MKHEKFLTALTAVLLSLVIAQGAMGCLVSAFDLELQEPRRLLLCWAAAGMLSAALLSFRHGSIAVVCLLSLAGGYIYHDGSALQQFQGLLRTLFTVYDRAYGWGMPQLPELPPEAVFADWPLGILGVLIIVSVCESVCRRRSAAFAVLLTVLSLCPCIVVTDTVPGEGWLLTVLAGLILLMLTSPVRRENPDQGVRLTFGAALPVVLALLALFHAVPQGSYVNQSETFRENILLAIRKMPQLMETGVTELADSFRPEPPKQVALSTLGERIPFTYPVMEVTAEKSGTLYLREQDYDVYDGQRWHAGEDREELFPHTLLAEEFVTIRTQTRKDIRYLPYHPAEETFLAGGSLKNPEGMMEYTVLRAGLPDDWRLTAYRSGDASDEWQEYLSLPEETRQGAKAMLGGSFSPQASNTEKADIIAAMVTNSAEYDLNPSRMPASEPDFALWFLRDGEKGYCVHFATAAAVLLRAADVPARYVSGYMLEAEAGRAVTVTEENAHAWAEYYEPNLGLWLLLEVTPGEEVPEETPLPPVIPETTGETVPETEAPATEAVTERPQPTEITATEPQVTVVAPPDTGEEEESWNPMPLLTALLLPLLLILQRSARLALRRHWHRTGETNQQALRRWQEAERLARILKDCPPPELQELALKAKFSQYELTDEELGQFDSFSQTCLHRMKQKPWYLRLIYRYIYAAY